MALVADTGVEVARKEAGDSAWCMVDRKKRNLLGYACPNTIQEWTVRDVVLLCKSQDQCYVAFGLYAAHSHQAHTSSSVVKYMK